MNRVTQKAGFRRELMAARRRRASVANPEQATFSGTVSALDRKAPSFCLALGKLLLLAAIALPSWHARAANVFFELPLKSSDVAYSAGTSKIYVTVPSAAGQPHGNRLVEINKFSGAIERSVFVGSEPGVIAVAHDGSFAYVGLDGAAAVRRVDLATMTSGLQFSLGRPDWSETFYVDDMRVLPGLSDSVVVSRRNDTTIPWHEGVAVYDSGVPRPITTPPQSGPNSIALLDASTVVGYDNTSTAFGLWRMAISADGIRVLEHVDNVLNGNDHRIVTNAGTVFSTSGVAVDGATFQALGSFGSAGPIVPEAMPGMVAIIGNDGASVQIFDRFLFSSTRTITLPSVNGTPKRASSCGPACLVFDTALDRVVIVLIDYDSIFLGTFD